MDGLLWLGLFCVICLFLGFLREGQGLGFRWNQAQDFFQPRSGSLGEVTSSWVLSVCQAVRVSQVGCSPLPSGHRRLSFPPVAFLEGQRCGVLGGGGPEVGVCDSLSHASASVGDSHHSGLVHTTFHQGEGFGGEDSGSSPQGSSGACASDSGLLQPYVCRHQGIGGWRPIIDLSALNLSVDWTLFRMETAQTVFRSVRRNDWMVSIDLKDAYLQIPIHPASHRFLRFTAGGRTWQFRVLCFGLHGASSLHLSDGSCLRVPPSVGRPDASVSRRLADSGVFSGGSLLGEGPCSQLMSWELW